MIWRFIKLPFKEKCLFFQCIFLSLFFMVKVSFSRNTQFGIAHAESLQKPIDDNYLESIKQAIRRVNKILPSRSKCLVNALTAQHLLIKHNLSSTLYLAVAKTEQEQLSAHAWLRCGDRVVTGFCNYSKYTVVGTFLSQGG